MPFENDAEDPVESDSGLQRLATASIMKLLAAYAVPSMLSLLAISSYEIADRIIVGHASGDEALSLLGVGLPFVFLLEASCATIKVGGGCAISRALGKNDVAAADWVLGCAVALSLAFGCLVAVAGTLFARQIAIACGATQGIVDGSAEYIFYLSLGSPFYFFLFAINAALRAQAKPTLASAVVVLSSIFNIALDLIFVAGMDMGAKGAAIGTALSQFAGAVVALFLICAPKRIVGFKTKLLNLRFHNVKEILTVGFASAAFEFSFMAYGLALNLMLSRFDDPRLIAANVTIASILLLVNAPMTGIAEAAQTIIAYNFGRHDKDRVVKSSVYAWAVGAGMLLAIGVVLYVFAEKTVLVFVSGDREFIQLTADALRIVVLMTPFMSSMLLVPDILGALGDARRSLLLNFVALFALQIPLVLILPLFWGATGVWLSFPVYDALSTLFCVAIFMYAVKRLFNKADKEATA